MIKFTKKRFNNAIILLVSCIVCYTALYAKDYAGHWAEARIDKWYTKGVVYGEGEGVFKPEGVVTRAELAAFIDRIFQYDTPALPRSFVDVLPDSWYEESVTRIASRGLMYLPSEHFMPQQQATRQEVAYSMAKAYGIVATLGEEVSFVDGDTIAPWAVSGVQALAQNGYLSGYPDGSFRPEASITRAELITLIDQMTPNYIQHTGVYTEVETGNVVVNTGDVTLQGVTIEGNLYITEGVGEGMVHLDGVTVLGDVVLGGGTVTLGGDYNRIEVATPYPVDFVAGTAKAIHVTQEGAKLHLHTETVTDYLAVEQEAEVVGDGVVKQSSIASLETLYITTAGVYMGETFIPIPIEGDTIVINLQELIEESKLDYMDSLIISSNKEGAYIQGYAGVGKLYTDTRYTFTQADEELGMIRDVLEQIKLDSPTLKGLIERMGATEDTLLYMLTEDSETLSLKYMMSQYDTVKNLVFELTGDELRESYSFKRQLKYGEDESVELTIVLQIK